MLLPLRPPPASPAPLRPRVAQRPGRLAIVLGAAVCAVLLGGCNFPPYEAVVSGALDFSATSEEIEDWKAAHRENGGAVEEVAVVDGTTELLLAAFDPDARLLFETSSVTTGIEARAVDVVQRAGNGGPWYYVTGERADAAEVGAQVVRSTSSGHELSTPVGFGIPLGGTLFATGLADLAADGIPADVFLTYGFGNTAYLAAALYGVAPRIGELAAADTVRIGEFSTPGDPETWADDVGAAGGDSPSARDLAVAIRAIDQVWIFRNDGDATFPEGDEIPDADKHDVGAEPAGVLAADLTGDGWQDLVVPNQTSDDVSVLVNQGDNSFSPETRFPAGGRAKGVAAGDLDRDGDLDVVVGAQSVTLLENDGNGSLAAPVELLPDKSFEDVRVRDFDGDGNLDVAATRVSGDEVWIALGRGDGTFRRPESLPIAAPAVDLTLDDLDGDGAPDLLYARGPVGSRAAKLVARFNDGEGSFSAEVVINDLLHDVPTAVVSGDVTDDGIPDAIVTDDFGRPSDVTVYPGNGDRTFQTGVTAPFGEVCCARALAVGDLDGDGQKDIGSVSGSSETLVETLVADGDGGFARSTLAAISAFPRNAALAIADLDGEGGGDIVAVHDGSSAPPVNVFFNDGSGGFGAPPVQPAIDARVRDVGIADVNGDGAPDVVLSVTGATSACPEGQSDAVVLLLNDGTGVFSRENFCGGTGGRIAFADAEGDGDVDLFLTGDDGFAPERDGFRVLLNNDGSGVFFGLPVNMRAESAAMDAADLDGDAVAEVVAAGEEIQVIRTPEPGRLLLQAAALVALGSVSGLRRRLPVDR